MNTSVKVTVIVPCYNEEKTIRMLLDALSRQTYPLSQMEVVIADGMSDDKTRSIIEDFSRSGTKLHTRVIDNPKRVIPAGLNRAIEAARGEYIIRLDAHSVPHPEYVARSVANLERRLGDNVGGVWKIVPSADSWMAKAIAAAAAHPLGVGDAKYRYADTPGQVDTVPFGAFRRDYLMELGCYDESLHTNEDYELNTRIRLAGGKLWLDPNIQVQYYSRANLGELARQYFRYGYWKVHMLRRYPGSLRWRQALPPALVFILVGLMAASLWLPVARWLLLGVLFFYSLVLLLSGLDISLQNKKLYMLFMVPLAIAAMHLSWGSAFLWSLLKQFFSGEYKRKPVGIKE